MRNHMHRSKARACCGIFLSNAFWVLVASASDLCQLLGRVDTSMNHAVAGGRRFDAACSFGVIGLESGNLAAVVSGLGGQPRAASGRHRPGFDPEKALEVVGEVGEPDLGPA